MSKKRDRKRSTAGNRGAVAVAAPAGVGDTTRRVYLILVAFCAGAGVMIVELTGNRILAPWFGNSLYTWTGLIGVILISISCGYYLGGYLADRRPDYITLAHLLALSAVLTMLTPALQGGIEQSIGGLGVVWGPILATAILFALPGLFLATASPFAVRLISLLWEDKSIGVSAGSIGMSSTLGSVAGTFGAGFLLIPHLSVRAIFLATGLVLSLLAVVGYFLFSAKIRQGKFVAVLPILAFAIVGASAYFSEEELPENVILNRTTFYHRIRVVEQRLLSADTRQEIDRLRTLRLDTTNEGSQLVNSREVWSDYQKYWELARVFCPHLENAAFLGGGAFTMPQALLDAFPEARADVIEIDPAVIEVGRAYFRVDEYQDRMNVIAADARRFLRFADVSYDLICADAYQGVNSIPAHLVTLEFFEIVKRRLNKRGVLIVNISGSFQGEGAAVFQGVAKTVAEVFEHQCVFATRPDEPEKMRQNVFVVAASHDLDITSFLNVEYEANDPIGRLISGYLEPNQYDLSGGLVFTDDFSPVEYLVSKTAKSSPTRE